MDRAVETIIRENEGPHQTGDSYLINAPYNAARTSPDLTVCTPVFDKANKKILFGWQVVAIMPTSGHCAGLECPPVATSIEEEGIYIETSSWSIAAASVRRNSTSFLDQGEVSGAATRCRTSTTEGADCRQRKGVEELHKMVGLFGPQTSCTPT